MKYCTRSQSYRINSTLSFDVNLIKNQLIEKKLFKEIRSVPKELNVNTNLMSDWFSKLQVSLQYE